MHPLYISFFNFSESFQNRLNTVQTRLHLNYMPCKSSLPVTLAFYKGIAVFLDRRADFGVGERCVCPDVRAFFLKVNPRAAFGQRIEGVLYARLAVRTGHTVDVGGGFVFVVRGVRVLRLDFHGRIAPAAAAAVKPFHGASYRNDRDGDERQHNYDICHFDHFLENIGLASANRPYYSTQIL